MKPPTSPCASLLAAILVCAAGPAAADSNLEFDQGTKGWQTVLDGVMGGLSTGRIAEGDGGTLRFSGELSLENNGGFSQKPANSRSRTTAASRRSARRSRRERSQERPASRSA